MQRSTLFLPLSVLFMFFACKPDYDGKIGTGTDPSKNYLTMKVNGVEWKADSVFAAFYPTGYNRAIIISGIKNPKSKYDQHFNINLYNKDGAGTFSIATGNADRDVAQLANVSETNYLYGSMLGFNMTVVVSKTNRDPAVVEATFSGELNGNAGDKILITDGKIFYRE